MTTPNITQRTDLRYSNPRFDSLKNRMGDLFKKRISEDLASAYKLKPGKAFEGLLGNYLFRQIVPEDMEIDLFDKAIRFNPSDNLGISLGQEDGDTSFNLDWRF